MPMTTLPTPRAKPQAGASPLDRLLGLVVRPIAPPIWVGLVVAVALIAAETVVVMQLRQVVPMNAFGALFLLGVLVISAGWDVWLAIATSAASAVVYLYFHRDISGSFLSMRVANITALVIFLSVALLANLLAGHARLRAAESEQRRQEADLGAELARLLLRDDALAPALEGAGRRIAEVLGLRFARLSTQTADSDGRREVVTLFDGNTALGSLTIPVGLSAPARQRVLRLVPSLQALLAAARDRETVNSARQREQDRLRHAQQLIEASHAEVSALASQQAALRRVATLVARGADPADVYPAAVTELTRGLGIDHAALLYYEGAEAVVVLAAHDPTGTARQLAVGERLPLEGPNNMLCRVQSTGRPTRADSFADADGATMVRTRRLGLRSGAAAPVVVDGRVRGALVVGSATALPADTEARVADFADLVATAIANAETRAELRASRARIVAAGDQARRRFERDLHDGAQQRLVSLGLEMRGIEAAAADPALRARICAAVADLVAVSTDLQEISRGIHPAILSRGGLGPAIKTLARRSAVPVELTLDSDALGTGGRLPESVEVAAYYVVAEALTNAAKHAQANGVSVTAGIDDAAAGAVLTITISDDGVGGAVTGGGSGLLGLKDRVEALSGRLDVHSPAGGPTTLAMTIPLGDGRR